MQELRSFRDHAPEPLNELDSPTLMRELHIWQLWTNRQGWLFLVLGCTTTMTGIMNALANDLVRGRSLRLVIFGLVLGVTINLLVFFLSGVFLRSSANHTRRYLQTAYAGDLIGSFNALRRFWFTWAVFLDSGVALIAVVIAIPLVWRLM